MGTSVWDYVTDTPGADYRSLSVRFGEPAKIASSYVNEMESEELLEGLVIARKVVWTVTVIASIILTLWIGVVILSYAKHVEAVNGFYLDEIDTISESIQEGME